MIKLSDSAVFENMRSVEQDLSFTAAQNAFSKYGVDFGEDKFVALGIRSLSNNLYTNLAWILSDQCRHSVKIAVFIDDANVEFQDAKEFGGSIFTQLEDSFQYLMLCNRTSSIIKGLERIDLPDYPEAAIREALLNALVHRDYSFSGSIIINVNGSCMEFISIGGLIPGLSEEDIRSGISQLRNRNLAKIFHRLKLIESYGTGIRRIFHLYKDCEESPRLEITGNTFKIILPNMNSSSKEEQGLELSHSRKAGRITAQMKTVLEYLSEYGEMGDEDLQELLKIKRTRCYVLTKQMQDADLIEFIGRGNSRRYKLK